MNNLAAALERQEKFSEAHALCKRAHEIFSLVHGEHVAGGRCALWLGMVRGRIRLTTYIPMHHRPRRPHHRFWKCAGASNSRTQHVASKMHEIEAAMKSQPRARAGSSSSTSQAGVEADPVHLLPPGAFLSDHSFQQLGVESYLASAADGLLERSPHFGEMWVPSSPRPYVSA
jgi:hypothetical protein